MDSSRGVKLVAALVEVAQFGRLRSVEDIVTILIADSKASIRSGNCEFRDSLSASVLIHCQDRFAGTVEAQFLFSIRPRSN